MEMFFNPRVEIQRRSLNDEVAFFPELRTAVLEFRGNHGLQAAPTFRVTTISGVEASCRLLSGWDRVEVEDLMATGPTYDGLSHLRLRDRLPRDAWSDAVADHLPLVVDELRARYALSTGGLPGARFTVLSATPDLRRARRLAVEIMRAMAMDGVLALGRQVGGDSLRFPPLASVTVGQVRFFDEAAMTAFLKTAAEEEELRFHDLAKRHAETLAVGDLAVFRARVEAAVKAAKA